MKHLVASIAIAGLSVTAVAVAHAEDLPPLRQEVQAGMLVYDLGSRHKGANTAAANLEYQSAPFRLGTTGYASLDPLLAPRLIIGTEISTSGYTNSAYAGAGWTWRFWDGFHVTPSFGAAVHDGPRHVPGGDNRAALGSSVLFHEELEIGYRLQSGLGFSATVSHMSNAGLNKDNPGLTFAGARIGFAM